MSPELKYAIASVSWCSTCCCPPVMASLAWSIIFWASRFSSSMMKIRVQASMASWYLPASKSACPSFVYCFIFCTSAVLRVEDGPDSTVRSTSGAATGASRSARTRSDSSSKGNSC